MLRATGAGSVENAESLAEALELARRFSPTILLLEWDLGGAKDGIDVCKSIRKGETPFKRDIAVVLASSRASLAAVETARIAGVDEYVIKPFSTGALTARLESVVLNRREFIDGKTYVGPCRRRKLVVDYAGALRRERDKDETAKRQAVLAKVDAMLSHARAFRPGAESTLRDLRKTSGDIRTAASEMADKLLTTAAGSLCAYFERIDSDAALDLTVVETHADAMKQIVALPNVEGELRDQVARALRKLVDKKLAAPAA